MQAHAAVRPPHIGQTRMNTTVNTNPPAPLLSDAQYARIAHLLPVERGNVRIAGRLVLDAVLHVRATGCAWRELPARFGAWHTLYTRARRWAHSGLLERIIRELDNAPAPSAAPVVVEAASDGNSPGLEPASIAAGRPTPARLLALADQLRPMVFGLAHHLMSERSGLRLSQLDVAILMTVESHPGLGTSALAQFTDQHPATIGQAVRRLAQQGCLVTSEQPAQDKRRAALQISDVGSEAIGEVRASRSGRLRRQLQGLTLEEIERLEDALRPLRRVLDGLREDTAARAPPAGS